MTTAEVVTVAEAEAGLMAADCVAAAAKAAAAEELEMAVATGLQAAGRQRRRR